MTNPSKSVGVLGCGVMGSGIAIVSARAGFKTVVLDTDENALNNGLSLIERFFAKSVEKGKMSAEKKDEIVNKRLVGTTEYEGLAECEFVIEAIFEDLELKQKVFYRVLNPFYYIHCSGLRAAGPGDRYAFLPAGTGHEIG